MSYRYDVVADATLQDYAKAQDCFRAALAVRPDVCIHFLCPTANPCTATVRIGYCIIALALLWQTAANPVRHCGITTVPLNSTLPIFELGMCFQSTTLMTHTISSFNLGISCINMKVITENSSNFIS